MCESVILSFNILLTMHLNISIS